MDRHRNKEIAERLYVSEGTVRNQLTSIYKKLGLSGRAQLVTYAFQQVSSRGDSVMSDSGDAYSNG